MDETKQQEDRTFLRERFIKTLLAMSGCKVTFDLQERTSVRASFGTSDVDILRFQVSDLETPIGVQEQALLRCSDILSLECEMGPQRETSSRDDSLSSSRMTENVG